MLHTSQHLHSARLVPIAFMLTILVGTALLMLPVSKAGDGAAPLLTALFTATSAVCVTGLIVVDTPTYWSGFGQVVILALLQIGGFGIMSGATLLGFLVMRRLRLTYRLVAQAETRSLALGDIVSVLRRILLATVVVELATAAFLCVWLHHAYGQPWGLAAWHGLFQAVSAFNNAGFSTYSDSLIGFATDPMVLGPIMVAMIIGGIGFPVLNDIRRDPRRPGRWSLHTKITLLGTAMLLPTGFIAVLVYEWSNPATLGPLAPAAKLLGAAFHSAMTRSGGFNAVDIGQLRPETHVVSYGLMLIGGGSAGTAGGIKVATFLVLVLVIWAEIRGEPDVTAFGRRISRDVQRQALTIVLLAVGFVGTSTLILLSVSDFPLQDVVFEAISAFATVGLSTGITPHLPPAGQLVIIFLMFVGRVGTITVATSLALNTKQLPYRYPEERPIVG
ncbi:TrkH family potassium uptake protein [Rhodomicrobium sp. Az07]|uniref:TrkH family potassium uptake protein n=1 Tax=Rhodomicrobium sp. Az07 TaxID=2839034 RepID=UPI0020366A5D|nr:potassium transporter TrkG [Rhodomicrobium sp. Az07]